ncbi:membrane protein insertion efficiency factor YidD [Ruania alba]|uniref:membrane protein insertion efficiency factor YidD n=1 Tax=Ruania alba TaxID=648782 RepID=UPI000B7C922C|nr:membrane protein insertion efficiency factor YidD [Ruania alba]
MTAERASRNPATVVLLALVRGYQLVVSPWFAPTCRYHPSCSAYAIDALRRHGPLKGTALAGWRLLRCNPWSRGGVDQVPELGRWTPEPWSAAPVTADSAEAVPSTSDLPIQPQIRHPRI